MAIASGEGGAGGGDLIRTRSANLSVDFSTTVQPPAYVTLHTLPITTVLPSSYLFILWTAGVLCGGPSAANNAVTVRVRHNGALLTPGNGQTANMVRSQINPMSYTRRLVVTAGVQTVVVEISRFGPVGNSVSISPLSLPDLMHSHLTLQEQRS